MRENPRLKYVHLKVVKDLCWMISPAQKKNSDDHEIHPHDECYRQDGTSYCKQWRVIYHICVICVKAKIRVARIQFHYSQTESSDAVRSEITFFFFTVWRIFIFYDFFATTEVYKAQIL